MGGAAQTGKMTALAGVETVENEMNNTLKSSQPDK